MAVDQPIIVYAKDKDKNKPSKRKMQELSDNWTKHKENEESLVGKKINLYDLLNTKTEEQSDGR